MVDYQNAFTLEGKLINFLKHDKKLNKYKLILHHNDKFGVDIVATAPGYEEFAIEIESTQGDKWPADAPYPTTWKKGFQVPSRKKKFFDSYPMCLFVKVNRNMTRAAVISMSYVFSSEVVRDFRNSEDSHFTNNDFYRITNAEHPALCFCKVEDLPAVIDEHFKHMSQLKRVNAKYTDMRPKFKAPNKKENE
jgi:hypothetical protein